MLKKPAISWKPRSYQEAGVGLMISQACAGLLYKPGLGKTSVVYAAFSLLKSQGYIKKMLVIAPIRPAYNVWPRQKNDYLEFQGLKVGVLHGDMKEAMLADDSYDIYVINPEGLPWLVGSKDPTKAATSRIRKFDMLVVDESIKFANSQSMRFKLLKGLLKYFKRRYILNGSPRPKSLLDLFGQIYILDEGAALGRYVTHYRTNYFYPGGYGGYDWSPQPGADRRIAERIAPLVQVVEQKGNVDLPELIINDIWVDLPPDAMLRYRQMEDALMIQVEQDLVVAANAAVASGKCRQIANGAMFIGEGEWIRIHEAKVEALQDLIEELSGEPLLVTYEFVPDRAILAEKLKIPCISSGNAKVDNANIQAFSEGRLQYVMGQPQSVSLGIDGFQNHCSNIAMFGVPWSFLNYEQVIDRVKRSGNKASSVTVHRILARNTVDERVIEVLDGRERGQEQFVSLLRRMATNR